MAFRIKYFLKLYLSCYQAILIKRYIYMCMYSRGLIFMCVDVCLGIKSVLVALMAGKAEVKYDPGLLDPPQIVQLISRLGFGASVMEESTVQDGVLDLSVSVWVHLSVIL